MDLPRRLAAEALGTGALVASVVGSGIMAERLTGDAALALLCNALATGAMLVVLIAILGPISGAHLNPAVTAVLAIRREIATRDAALYVPAQIAGGVAGTMLAHLMFAEPALQTASTARTGMPLWLAEAVAAFGLVSVVIAGARFERRSLPWLAGLYITAAYWFTASTSFANPAVTIARSLTDSFSGIRPADAPAFIAAQLAGAFVAMAVTGWLVGREAADAGPAG
jgi:glycerol uptake facilitator-like aquaporin